MSDTLDLKKICDEHKEKNKSQEAKTQDGYTPQEQASIILEKNIEKLKNIYKNKIFSSRIIDYPVNTKSKPYHKSTRYIPTIILGFGKYPDKTLFEVFIDDPEYFNWMFENDVLKFSTQKTSPHVKYSENNTY